MPVTRVLDECVRGLPVEYKLEGNKIFIDEKEIRFNDLVAKLIEAKKSKEKGNGERHVVWFPSSRWK